VFDWPSSGSSYKTISGQGISFTNVKYGDNIKVIILKIGIILISIMAETGCVHNTCVAPLSFMLNSSDLKPLNTIHTCTYVEFNGF
jgi:hypothetical protein